MLTSHIKGGIQLPNDVIEKGYIKTSPYKFEQVFYSRKYNFTGTEEQFKKRQIAYEYVQIDQFTRLMK